MEIRLPYGHTYLTANLPEHVGVDYIEAPQAAPAADPLGVVAAALDNLLGDLRWGDFAAARSVAIAISDKTRPVPHDLLLPPLLERLAALGIPDTAITFYVAVGTHAPMRPDEFPLILPEAILQRYRTVSHDAGDESTLVHLGETSRGTPVWANRAYVQADLKIVTGNIEPHQFAGFSGGVKSAAIGLAAHSTINANHSLLTHPDSQLGAYETNPLRQDIEAIGQKMGIHLALNAILNHDRRIVQALAGDPYAVMRQGVGMSRGICQVAVRQQYTLVIASPGGHPKDINLYQAQKAIGHAVHITRPGGTVILTAACPEGTGSQHYEEWMVGKHSYAEILQHFQAEGFRIGPHKAYQIARDASQVRLMFVSEMAQDWAQSLLLNPVPNLQTAVDLGMEGLKPGEPVGILQHAVSTIPYVK